MSKRSYHQYCALAYALDIIGERWTLLIIRDLLLGPKRYKDLLDGLPGIGTNILAARLKELEQAGLILHYKLPPPAGSTVYALTEYGRELDDVIIKLASWGAKSCGARQPDQLLKSGSMILGLRGNFLPDATSPIYATYELRFGNDDTYTVRIAGDSIETNYGPATNPDVIIGMDAETFLLLGLGDLSTEEAITQEKVHIVGDPSLFIRFTESCHIGSRERACPFPRAQNYPTEPPRTP